ncbi:unnamed protein product [Soboliphyme baturini]|uniref:CA domain-containing protein n=1 Tax=Soboliphyme baturini TaxID=241478 RepID=A0A183J3Y7_9BILA|nr:unnamed protein product [Soboliphyme baturini]
MNSNDNAPNTTDRLFDNRHYSVDVLENLPPPVSLIDLNCSYEIQQKPVYYVINRGQSDKFNIDENTGVITTLVPLDREEQSIHILVIACLRRKQRRSRDLKANMNLLETVNVRFDEALVIIKVGDVNDNPPSFVESKKDIIFPVELDSGSFPRYVGVVKAIDPDVSSKIKFSIVHKDDDDSKMFLINRHNGEVQLRTSSKDMLKTRTKFKFTVKITDSVNEAMKQVVVFYLATQTGITMTSSRSADVISSYRKTLEKKFHKLTGKEVIIGRADDLVLAQYNGSQVQIYGIDPATMDVVPQAEMARLVASAFETIRKDLTPLKLISIFSPYPEMLDGSPWLSAPEISLIVISSIVISLTCAMLCLFIRWCKRKEAKRISREYMIDTNPYGTEAYEEKHLRGMYWNSNESS